MNSLVETSKYPCGSFWRGFSVDQWLVSPMFLRDHPYYCRGRKLGYPKTTSKTIHPFLSLALSLSCLSCFFALSLSLSLAQVLLTNRRRDSRTQSHSVQQTQDQIPARLCIVRGGRWSRKNDANADPVVVMRVDRGELQWPERVEHLSRLTALRGENFQSLHPVAPA